MRVVWAPRVILRAAEIAEFIASDRPAAARRWAAELFGRAGALRNQPRRGRKVPELNRDDIREIRFGEYRVVYRLDPKRVVILTVRHGRRRWDPAQVKSESG